MLAIGYSAAIRGIEAYVVRVEVVGVPVAQPSIHIVGLADRSIQESKERVDAAVRSCGFLFPTYKVVVNLAPADVRKEGAAFDVALALSVLAMDQQLDSKRLRDFVAIGELALDGAVKPVGGVLPIAIGIKRAGFKHLVLPADNIAEAAVDVALGRSAIGVPSGTGADGAAHAETATTLYAEDFEDVRGQERVKRAME